MDGHTHSFESWANGRAIGILKENITQVVKELLDDNWSSPVLNYIGPVAAEPFSA